MKISMNSVQKYLKACNKKSILETKPTVFHGINPTLTYPPSGESFALPRYISKEMKEARTLNIFAREEAKQLERFTNNSFPKASKEDLIKLTSQTVEDSANRTTWINPKDGEIYNLLKVGEAKDGKYIMRILNEDGAFVKEVQVSPKVHAIIDSSTGNVFARKEQDWKFNELYELSHADYMKMGALRTNPFEKVIMLDVQQACKNGTINSELKNIEIYRELTQRIKNGEKIDIISQSRGATGIGYDLKNAGYKINGRDYNDIMSNISLRELTNTAKTKGIRFLNSAGNEGGESLNRNLLNTGAEGVGAIAPNGKVAEYSGTRNTVWTQHYERSSFPITFSKHGINITGASGIDIKISNPLIGQNSENVIKRYNQLIKKARDVEFKLDHATEINEQKYLEKYLKLINKAIAKIEYYHSCLRIDQNNIYQMPEVSFGRTGGTSLATAIRAAKINLNKTMEEVL